MTATAAPLATLHWGPPPPAPTVVLVHGFTQTARSWLPIAEVLAIDHHVVAVDAPGHGGSGAVRAGIEEGAALLGDTAGRGTYVGYSMGGRLCLRLAVDRPALVERLVLLGATAGIEEATERAERVAADEQRAAELERDGLERFLTGWLANPLFGGLSSDAANVADRRRNTVEGLASSLRLASTGAQEPIWDRLGAITAPTLVLAGEHDTKFVQLGRRLAAAIGANARFETIADAGHSAHLEQPATFLAILREFLGGPPTDR